MSLLGDFFHGELAPHELLPSLEYAQCSSRLEECEIRIREGLGDQEQADRLIRDYVLAAGRLTGVAAEENFIYGFELGARLMLEILRG